MSIQRSRNLSRISRQFVVEILEERLPLSASTCCASEMLPEPSNELDNPIEQYATTLINPGANSSAKYDALTGLDDVRKLYGLDGDNQTVVVIDSGIAYNHINLGGGYGTGYRVVGGYDFADNDSNPYDSGPRGSHGTHVAGIISSTSTKYPGVAQGVDLVALRIFSDDGTSDLQDLVDALKWVHENKDSFENPITTINLSVGFACDDLGYYNEINKWFKVLNEDGIFISVAAGNSFESITNKTQLSYPAMSDYVVAVGACDTSGNLSYFSQRDSGIIVAPGQSIKSTVPDYVGNSNGIDDDYSAYTGTSMAAPYVSGASTLIREAMQLVGMTNITQEMIYQVMVTTADKIFDTATNQYYSRLNIKNAIESILPKDLHGNTLSDAANITSQITTSDIEAFFNTVTDCDYFSFVANETGSVKLVASMSSGLNGKWDISGIDGAVIDADGSVTFNAIAGQKYSFGFLASGKIGLYTITPQFGGTPKTDTDPVDNTPTDADPVDNTPTDTDPVDNTPTDTNPVDNTPTDTNPVDNTSTDTNPVDNTPTDTDPVDNTPTDADPVDNTPTKQPTAVTVSQSTLVNQQLTNDGTWYVLTATQSGIMTIDLVLPSGVSANEITIECGDHDGNIMSTHRGVLRTDVNITAGDSLWVRISTNSGKIVDNASIRLTNLLRQIGSEVIVNGTTGNDTISYSAGTCHTIIINGVTYTFNNSDVSNININAQTGNDSVTLNGTSESQTLVINGTSATFSGNTYNINVANAQHLVVHGNGDNDTFRYYDTAGNDQLTVRSGEITIASSNFLATVTGMGRFFAYSSNGGHDTVALHGSTGNDTLNVNATYSVFRSCDTTSQLYGFASLTAESNGGYDTATFTDTGSGDLFNGSYESMKRISSTQYVEANGFAQINLTSVFGGNNTVQLEDSFGDDTLYFSANSVSLNGDHYGISVRGFDHVHASAINGGHNRVVIYDTIAAKKIIADKNTIVRIDNTYQFSADGFDEIWAYGHYLQTSKIEQKSIDYVLNLFGLWNDEM